MTDGKSGRLMSLDALRGADMLFIMGFSSAVCLVSGCVTQNTFFSSSGSS